MSATPAAADEIPPSTSTKAPTLHDFNLSPAPTSNLPEEGVCGKVRGMVGVWAVFRDADPEDKTLLANFRLKNLTDPAQSVDFGWKTVANGSPLSVDSGQLPNGHLFEATAQVSDGTNLSEITVGCRFRVDAVASAAPVVSSTEFPPLGSPTPAASYGGDYGSFSVSTPNDPEPGDLRYYYSLNEGNSQELQVDAKGIAQILTKAGRNTLKVWAIDGARNVSPTTTYVFNAPTPPVGRPTGEWSWGFCSSKYEFELCGPLLQRYEFFRGMHATFPKVTSGVLTASDGIGRYIELADGSAIFWSPKTGARDVKASLRQYWEANGGITGPLGYPNGYSYYWPGVIQFQKGIVFWNPNDASYKTRSLTGAIADTFRSVVPAPTLADAPTSDLLPTPDGKGQMITFPKFTIISTPEGGAVALSPEVLHAWQASGGIDGPLGYPVNRAGKPAGSTAFKNGVLTESATAGQYVAIMTPFLESYTRWSSTLGRPVGAAEPRDGYGQVQLFEKGMLAYSDAAKSAFAVQGRFWEKWLSVGGEAVIGLPAGDVWGAGARQHFQNGRIYEWSNTKMSATWGPIYQRWLTSGLGDLGYDQTSTSDGVGQYAYFYSGTLPYGYIYWSPATGARVVFGGISYTYQQLGVEALGFPLDEESDIGDGKGRKQTFEKGFITWSPADYLALAIRNDIAKAWSVGPQWYGAAKTAELTAPDGVGRYQVFDKVRFYWTPKTGAHEIHGGILNKWWELGGERGFLGYPTTDEQAIGNGRVSHFERGSIYWSAATGPHELHGGIKQRWLELGGPNGLGFPLTDEMATSDGRGRYVVFERGSIFWTATTGAVEIYGGIGQAWASQGWNSGKLGYPTRGEYTIPGGRRADFEHGYITWMAATGQTRIVVTG
ncbi:LGFP repeat-containing protein [Yinghuangia soli]|uniref:LGFP repeat-containing protein n=1 Tax=Yinghuangia soli TaxID=2908204 RepID=A0AA41TX70_9ACTN|nr:hypothetical protein [Yinghuangia soli]MCF2526528.1 hypothetical protein [Yinghuangia soli]